VGAAMRRALAEHPDGDVQASRGSATHTA
jgi:hypothetical protein